jgi:hypothetical protein
LPEPPWSIKTNKVLATFPPHGDGRGCGVNFLKQEGHGDVEVTRPERLQELNLVALTAANERAVGVVHAGTLPHHSSVVRQCTTVLNFVPARRFEGSRHGEGDRARQRREEHGRPCNLHHRNSGIRDSSRRAVELLAKCV